MTAHPPHRHLSLLKPTGHLTLGNLLGALRPMAAGQDDADCFYGVCDLHALTVAHDPARLRSLTAELSTLLLAAGGTAAPCSSRAGCPPTPRSPTCWSARPTPAS